MTFTYVLACDHRGCESAATLHRGDVDPVLTDANDQTFVLDTGWLSLPPGWTFRDDEDEPNVYCPRHPPGGDVPA